MDDDERIEALVLNKVQDPKLKYSRSKGLFPMLAGSDYDQIQVLIFAYLDIKKRAMLVLSKLNSKGYQLTFKYKYHHVFSLLHCTPIVCRNDAHRAHAEDLKEYSDVEISTIELFEDRYYLKGITVTYLCDGWRSVVKSNLQIQDKSDLKGLKKSIITFKKGQ